MKKIVFCLVAVLLYTSLLITDYLNPIYPVYAENGESISEKPARLVQDKKINDSKSKIASKNAELKMELNDRQEKVASRVGEMREEIASKTAMLKAKLAKFKDKAKATKVEKINATLETIDTNRTSMMAKHLEVLTKIVGTIETKVNEGEANGKNVNTAKSAISEARTAIQTASAAVTAQNEKDYTIEATSEATVKADAKRSRDSLLKDLKSTHELVKKAQEAVVTALKSAKEALGVNPTPEAS